MSPTGTFMQCQPRTFSWTRMLTNACAYALTSPLEQSTVQVKTIRCMYASILSFLASKHCNAKRRCCAYLGFQQPISRWSHNGCTPFHVLILNSRLTSLCVWCCGLSANMSDSSRTLPPELLPSEDLHPLPMPVINLGHLSLDSATRYRVVDDVAKACRDLGYFQVCSLRTLHNSFFCPFLVFALTFSFV